MNRLFCERKTDIGHCYVMSACVTCLKIAPRATALQKRLLGDFRRNKSSTARNKIKGTTFYSIRFIIGGGTTEPNKKMTCSFDKIEIVATYTRVLSTDFQVI